MEKLNKCLPRSLRPEQHEFILKSLCAAASSLLLPLLEHLPRFLSPPVPFTALMKATGSLCLVKYI